MGLEHCCLPTHPYRAARPGCFPLPGHILPAGIWAPLCPPQRFHGARAALWVSPPCGISPLGDIIFLAQKGGRCPPAERLTPLPAHSRDRSPSCWLFVGSRRALPVPSSFGMMRGCRAQSSPARPCPCPPGGTPVVQGPGAAGRGSCQAPAAGLPPGGALGAPPTPGAPLPLPSAVPVSSCGAGAVLMPGSTRRKAGSSRSHCCRDPAG